MTRVAHSVGIEDPRFYLWFDTEYTSLDLDRAHPMQVALLITDTRLRRVVPPDQDVRLVLRLPRSVKVSPWVRRHLAALMEKCKSRKAVSPETADRQMAKLVDSVAGRPHQRESARPVLAGNSIHADWRILQRFFPRLRARVNYRLLDVTALKLQWWARARPDPVEEFDKDDPAMIRRFFPEAHLEGLERHDAYYDVQASIAELAFYRKKLCRPSLFRTGTFTREADN